MDDAHYEAAECSGRQLDTNATHNNYARANETRQTAMKIPKKAPCTRPDQSPRSTAGSFTDLGRGVASEMPIVISETSTSSPNSSTGGVQAGFGRTKAPRGPFDTEFTRL